MQAIPPTPLPIIYQKPDVAERSYRKRRCANFVLNTAEKTGTDRRDSTRFKSCNALSTKRKTGNQSQNREFKNLP